ncbi:MAG: bifunctional (p)ppGpp synthetase/guanosine-3',5'-bis(diphosphate) 3'-pyrophosphohydrolase [Archangiaceae bacterium]|nr:bifunctional (p)ppGpp synthetase/guanosine-3',5'-bis(diphosphate) 3'-pyrophosphohydrolase [Archangiaceae bacterium]
MWDADAYKRALDFAARAHGAQQVPGSGFPYVVHLTKVAAEVMRACTHQPSADATLAVTCALLHDSMEDAGVTKAQLVQQFGAQVADGVDALTKRDAVPKPDRMRDSLTRIAAQPPEIAMVKLADRITNLEPAPPHWSAEKRSAYRAEAHEIARALAGRSAWLDERLQTKISEYAIT